MIAADAQAALRIFAAAPIGAGLILKGAPCPARDAILAALGDAGGEIKLRRLPLHIAADRLSGGIDMAASLATGRQIGAAGVLDGPPAILALTMAERWDRTRLSPIAAALDAGRFGLIALDESGPDEKLADAIADRCAFRIDLTALPDDFAPGPILADLGDARRRLPTVVADDEIVTALCNAAAALGAPALRGPLFAVRCARIAAALEGRDGPTGDDAALAARLVLSPRATRFPPNAEDQAAAPQPDPDRQDTRESEPQDPGEDDAGNTMDDKVLDAARVVLPPNLLDIAQRAARRTARAPGRQGDAGNGAGPGRPVGSRQGVPRDGLRLDLIGTLRAAVPWQRVRGRSEASPRLRVTRGDLHILRCKPRSATITIFAVDASGSQALARMAEAKGAVELLLADCYVRRDSVALIAFRGRQAEVLLPPTRAPARARRCLAGLAGGGGTPLAAGLMAASALADAAARRGETPTIVMLTDGQANIARSGAPGRAQAQQDAMAAAKSVKDRGHRALLIDTASRRQTAAQSIADAMGGRYLPLPRMDASSVSAAVRAAREG